MPTPKPPKGWYRLRKGTILKEGDKFSVGENVASWKPIVFIRKLKPKARI